MATPKKKDAVSGAGDLLSEILGRSLEAMRDFSVTTGGASMDASISGAKRLVKFQRSSVKAGLALVAKVQKHTEKSLHAAAKEGKWLPLEGKEAVDEWSKMMKSGVDEFSRVTDKSFELLLTYLDRVEKEKKARSAKKASVAPVKARAKRSVSKKAPPKRKTASKKDTLQSPKA